MMNTGEALKATRTLGYSSPVSPDWQAYRAEKARIHNEFEAYLAAEYAFHLPVETHPIIWINAWGCGEDSLLDEVEANYVDAVGFLDSALRAMGHSSTL